MQNNFDGAQIYCAQFDNIEPTWMRQSKTSWGTFCEYVRTNPKPYALKGNATVINLARYVEGCTHFTANNVIEVYGVGIDVDSGNPADVLFTVRALINDGLTFLIHTTHSNDFARGYWKFRIWVPFAQPVTGLEYKRVFRRVYARYSPKADSRVCDPSRRYFEYSYFPGDTISPARMPWCCKFDGQPLHAADLGEADDSKYRDIKAVRSLSSDILAKLSKKWVRSQSPSLIDLGDRLSRVLRGVQYAVKGERDTITFQLVSKIVEAYPDVDEKALLVHFQNSLNLMQQEDPFDCLTHEQFEQKVINARNRVSENKDVSSMSPKRIEDIRQYFASDRTEGYSAPELQEICDSLGVTREQLPHCWILQSDRSYYLIGGPKVQIFEASHESLVNVARVVLAPSTASTYDSTEQGPKLKGLSRLLEQYSTPIREVRRSMVAQDPKLDLQEGRLTIPVCPMRKLEPERSPEVEQWLSILAGPSQEQLLAWLHFSTDLSRPLSALVMIGARSAGKSLLVRGLSRIWTTGAPPKLREVLGDFNAAVERCPVVVSDESLPKDSRGREPIAELRELIQSTTRFSNQKFRAAQPLDGAIRLVMAANSHSLLTIHDAMSGDDAPAFAERLFEINATSRSREYLDSIGGRARIDDLWIEKDALAKHILYLVHYHNVPWYGRFGVKQDSTDLTNRLVVRGGVRAQLCEFFVKSFANRSIFKPTEYFCAEGRIFAHIDCISSNWDIVLRRQATPSTAAIASALSGISCARHVINGSNWYEIDVEKLKIWAREVGYSFAA